MVLHILPLSKKSLSNSPLTTQRAETSLENHFQVTLVKKHYNIKRATLHEFFTVPCSEKLETSVILEHAQRLYRRR